jgi:hypothetical protein
MDGIHVEAALRFKMIIIAFLESVIRSIFSIFFVFVGYSLDCLVW